MKNIYLLIIFALCIVAAMYWYLKPEPSTTLTQQHSLTQKTMGQENSDSKENSESIHEKSIDRSIEPVDTKSDLSIKPIDPETDPGNQVLNSK